MGQEDQRESGNLTFSRGLPRTVFRAVVNTMVLTGPEIVPPGESTTARTPIVPNGKAPWPTDRDNYFARFSNIWCQTAVNGHLLRSPNDRDKASIRNVTSLGAFWSRPVGEW